MDALVKPRPSPRTMSDRRCADRSRRCESSASGRSPQAARGAHPRKGMAHPRSVDEPFRAATGARASRYRSWCCALALSQLRQDVLGVEGHEALLVRPHLVDVDVVEARVDVLADGLE